MVIILTPTTRPAAKQAIDASPDGYACKIAPRTRSLEQNAKLWACLGDIAEQVIWHGVRLTADEWKDVLTASLKRSKVVPGLDGGFVVLGQRTSRMTKAEFSELLELTLAFGAEHEVKFTYQEVT